MSVFLTFDLDNTLWDVDPVITRAEYAMESWFEEYFPGFSEAYSSSVLHEMKKDILAYQSELSHDVSGLRREVYGRALKGFGIPREEAVSMADAALKYFCEWRQKVDLFPNVRDVLTALGTKYAIGAITNGNADVFHPYIGLGDLFEFSIRADQAGISKPDAKLFELAAEQANIAISDVIHIGDHPVDDVYGAVNAGAKSIWFNRHGARRWNPRWEGRPDAEVHSLTELPYVIQSLI